MKEIALHKHQEGSSSKGIFVGAGNRILFKCRSGTHGLMFELVIEARWSVLFVGQCVGADHVFGSVSLCIL